MTHEPARAARFRVAIILGLFFAAFSYKSLEIGGAVVRGGDFTYSWIAARAVMAGLDPYAVVRASATPYGGPYFYPMPAALVAVPFSLLPMRLGGAALMCVAVALVAYGVTRRGWWRLIMLVSPPMIQGAWAVSWVPFVLGASLFVPTIGLTALKPNLGLALGLGQRSWRAVVVGAIVGLALVGLSFALLPTWFSSWWREIHDPAAAQYVAPVLVPFGAVLLLAALKWRRPEARLLLAMACVPQTGMFADQLLLFLIPNSRREMLTMAGLAEIAFFASGPIHGKAGPEVNAMSLSHFPWVLASIYLPALVMVMRRPNECPRTT